MPDLMTHLLIPYALGRAARAPRRRPGGGLAMLCLGAVWPDLLNRAPNILFSNGEVGALVGAAHTPVGSLVLAMAFVFVLPAPLRPQAFGWMSLGMLSHYALDLLQLSVGPGSYYWFFPFSWLTGQAGLVWPDETVLGLPVLAGLALAVESFAQWRARRRT